MALTLKLDDIKPLLGAVGLGQDPTPAPKPVNDTPPPPMQMPPTPAAAGFSEWAGDPQNAKKVTDGITQPGTPLLPPPPQMGANMPPPPQMASMNPPVIPRPSIAPPTQGGTPNIAQWEASNPGSVENHMGKGQRIFQSIAAGLVGAAGGIKGDPLAGANYAHGIVANDQGVDARNQAKYQAAVIQPLQQAAQLEDTKSQTAQRDALAARASTQADDMTPFQLSPAQAAAINQPGLAGTTATMRDYNRLLGQAGNNNTSQANNKNNNDTKLTTNTNDNTTKKGIADNKDATQKAMADAANKTKALVAAMHDQTSRANNANTNANKGKSTDGNFKVPADVTKRAALASNVLENADAVEGIISKRPDIIGAAGGRYSNVQQMIGSNDPDIQALGVRMHNMALASNGAHGVRAQQAIQKTEDELFGNFKAGPEAIRGALGATRGSMQTFLNDEQNFSTTGKRGGGITPAPTGGATPTHRFNAATGKIEAIK